jgi:hypothetical protein
MRCLLDKVTLSQPPISCVIPSESKEAAEMGPASEEETVFCFFDTNILLHYPMFDEVDWPDVIDAPTVCLMVAPIVIHELGDIKDDNRNERRQTRERDVLPKLDRALPKDASQSAPVRSGVFIRDILTEPQISWSDHRLDENIHDDRLLVTILEFRTSLRRRMFG